VNKDHLFSFFGSTGCSAWSEVWRWSDNC